MMSSSHLPDDVSLWPTNPYELLGVDYNADARVARRAYLALVRRFKPEHAPEQFKRIREAYEFVEQQVKMRELYRSAWSEEDETSEAENDDDGGLQPLAADGDEAVIVAEVSEHDAEPTAPAPRGVPLYAPDPEDECAAIWRELRAGAAPSDAFVQLVALHERHGGSGEACLRLYWLTVAAPEVDASHRPIDWLSEGLRVSRLEGRLRELYRRELDTNPHEAASERCEALLRLPAPIGPVADMAEWRWRALGRIGRWDLLLADLSYLRQRIVFDEEETWGRLLLTAIDQLVWSDAPQAQQAAVACRQELDSMNHLHGALERDLDRLDLLWEVAAGWRRLRVAVAVPRAWSEIIPLTWSRDYARIRPRLLPIMREMARDPLRSLGMLDEMARHSAAAVAQLGFTIEGLRSTEERYDYDSRSEDDRTALVRKFLNTHDCSNYRAIRRQLLSFCLVEVIEPAAFAHQADELTRHLWSHGGWQDLIAEDGPLRYVYSAYQTFWS